MFVPGKERKLLALLLWCHCHQIASDLFFSLTSTPPATGRLKHQHQHHRHHQHQHQHHQHHQTQIPWPAGGRLLFASAAAAAAGDEEQPGGINQAPLTPGHEIKLTCHIPKHPDEEFSWSRIRLLPATNRAAPDNQQTPQEEEQLLPGDQRFVIRKQELIIRWPTYDDVGDYFCRVKTPHDDVDGKKMIAVRVRPYVHEFAIADSTLKSAIVAEGARLVIPCNVTDDYYPNTTITWHMSKFDEDDMLDLNHDGLEGIQIQLHNATSNALVFERVTQDHRRFYKCRVSNGIIENSRVILIRVKNQFAFFWPLVGIIVEIVILFAVICVVQKKKVEPDADNYDRKAIQM